MGPPWGTFCQITLTSCSVVIDPSPRRPSTTTMSVCIAIKCVNWSLSAQVMSSMFDRVCIRRVSTPYLSLWTNHSLCQDYVFDIHCVPKIVVHQTHGNNFVKCAENAASVRNACLDKIVCYLHRIFNRNRKLKQQVSKQAKCIKIGCVFKNQWMYDNIFVCIFSFRYANTWTSNFCKVVWQRTEGMVRSVVCVLFTALSSSKEFWKSVKNWQSYRHEFGILLFGTQCIFWWPRKFFSALSFREISHCFMFFV